MGTATKDIEDVCSALGIDGETKRLAMGLMAQCGASLGESQQEDLTTTEVDELQRLNMCCFLYASVKLRAKAAKNTNNGAILSQLLSFLDISIADFLKELPGHIKLLTPALPQKLSDDPERRIEIRELQTSMVHSCLLSKKARDTFAMFFKLPVSSPILHVMWLLFLVAKARLLPRYPDLVSAFNMLLCVADFMLAHVQNAMAVIDFNDHMIFPVRTADGGPDTLASIAQVSNTSLTDTRPLAKKLNHLYQELFSKTEIMASNSHFSFPDGQDLESRNGFSGLLSGDNITRVADLLDRAYQKALNETVEIDERPFIKQEALDATAQKLSSNVTPPTISKCSLTTPTRSRDLPQTPVRLMRTPLRPSNHILRTPTGPHMGPGVFCVTPCPGVGTPISESMRLIAWLRDSLANSPAQPSNKLKEILESCGANADTIHSNATRLSTVVFSHSPEKSLAGSQPDARAIEGLKLYYRVLEALLKDEAARLEKQKDRLFNLITNTDFHKCLLACSFEMIIASYGMGSLTFPAVLERMQIQAFDLCSIIESFARREPSLPKALQIHLFRVEEMIMESLAWEKGSCLYRKMYEACTPAVAVRSSDLESANDSGPTSPRARSSSSELGGAERPKKVPVEKLVATTIIQDRTQEDGPEGGKRGLEGEQEVSPAKLQKGLDESKVVPEEASPTKVEAKDHEGAAKKAPESPPKTPRRPLNQALAPPERVPSTPLNPSKTSAFSAFMSPQRPTGESGQSQQRLPLQFGSPQSDVGNRRARKLVGDFLGKVIRLGLHRASELCDRVDLTPFDTKQILREVYTILHHIVWENTHLLYNRHLDQIVLCSLYAICKVHTMNNISFRELAAQYRKMPRTKIDTYRTVVVEQSEIDMVVSKTGDIIVFYNSVFIPHMKTLVLNIGCGKHDVIEPPSNGVGAIRRTPGGAQTQNRGLLTPPAYKRPQPASPLSGRIVISRQSPKQPFLSPKTKIMYAGRMGESAHAYQSPAKDLKYITSRIAAHSQSPIAIPPPPEQILKGGTRSQRRQSSEQSYSSAQTSDDEPSNFSPSDPSSSPARGGYLGSLRGSLSSPNGHLYSHRAGGSGLESLHNAAMLLGSQEAARGGGSPTPSNGGTRRSRRQMGYAPRN